MTDLKFPVDVKLERSIGLVLNGIIKKKEVQLDGTHVTNSTHEEPCAQ